MAEPSINTIEDLDIETKILMLKGEKGDPGTPGGAVWGTISGNINSQTDLKTAIDAKANTSDLGNVCFSNSYNDLSDKPTIPTRTSQLTNDSGFVANSDLATVATSGLYSSLINKPTYMTDLLGVLPVNRGGTGGTDGEIFRKFNLFSSGGATTNFTLNDTIHNYVKIGVAYIEDNNIWPSITYDRISYKEFFLEPNITEYGLGLDIAVTGFDNELVYFLTVLEFSGTSVEFKSTNLYRIRTSGVSIENRTLTVKDVYGYKT